MMFGGKQVVVCGYGEVRFNLSVIRNLKCILQKYTRIFHFCGHQTTFIYHFKWGKSNFRSPLVKVQSFFFPLHFQLPGSSKGDFPPPGADLTSAVCDSLPASEPAQCHPGGQVDQVCFSGRWYVYSEKTKYTRLVWTLQLRFFSPLTFPFYSHETWLCFQCPLLSLCPHL